MTAASGDSGGGRGRVLAVVAALAASWIVFDLLVWGFGESPRVLFGDLLDGTWGTAYGAGQVLFKATPLVFTGLAVDMALRAGLFNIGAEGQLAVASVVVGGVASRLPDHASPLVVVLLVAVAALTGALWALPAAWLKSRFGAHEVISTIMMNRIADAFVALLLGLGLAVPGTVRTRDVVAGARIPRLDVLFPAFAGSAANFALVIAVLAGAWLGWAYRATRVGREIGLVGLNARACAAEHIPADRRITQAMLGSGALAGMASIAVVLGYKGYFEQGLGAGAGFGGIAVAILGRGSVVGIVLAALLFGTLAQGGLAINAKVPMEVMDVMQGFIVAGVALADVRVRAVFAGSGRRAA